MVLKRLSLALSFCVSSTLWAGNPTDAPPETTANGTRPPQGSSGADLFKNFATLVFRVQTAERAEADKQEYGTGFVVDVKGRLLTNYHVVADSAVSFGDKKLFVIVDGKPIQAKILNIDMIADLALIEIPKKFDRAISLSDRMLEQGEVVYSFGFPQDLNPSIVQGNFNGLLSSGPYETAQLSSAINRGMSGGPTLDSAGKLVGVNVSILRDAQSISFLVPPSKIQKFLAMSSHPNRALSQPWTFKILHEQLKEAQQSILAEWKTIGSEPMVFDGWKLRKALPSLKCWSNGDEPGKSRLKTKVQSCDYKMYSSVWPGFNTGYFTREIISYSAPDMNLYHFYDSIQTELSHDSSPFYPVLQSSPRWRAYLSSFHCKTSSLKNAHELSFSVAYCTRAYGQFVDLYDTVVRVASRIAEPKLLTAEYVFAGFDEPTVRQIVQTEIDSIQN